MMWITPITNRTRKDVERAKALNDKISEFGWSRLTIDEQEEWARGLIGCLKCEDLNRIEQNSAYLSQVLYSYGYGFNDLVAHPDWQATDFPYSAEMERIRSNVQGLISAYYEQMVSLPSSLENPTHEVINDLESVIMLIKQMIGSMEQGFRYCGTFACGQEVVLP